MRSARDLPGGGSRCLPGLWSKSNFACNLIPVGLTSCITLHCCLQPTVSSHLAIQEGNSLDAAQSG